MRRILFEPWAMGDALIAASMLKILPGVELACSEKWHPLIRSAFGDTDLRLSVGEARYASRSRHSPFAGEMNTDATEGVVDVFSIRGDPRDYLRATKLYPGAKIHMSGWIPFLVWHMPFLDAPYRACRLQVMNRYDLWCRLLHIERGDLAQHFFQSDRVQIKKHKALIHVGAQWKSKQYPFVFALIEQLSALGLDVQTVRGPGDSVPNGLRAIEELKDDALVQAMRDSDLVITNDSGPLHLAALLGLPVFAISRVSNLAYWGPPGIFPICSASMPKGYAPPRAYFSDDPGSDWPSAQQVISIIRKHTRL